MAARRLPYPVPVNTLICLSTCPNRETAGRTADALAAELPEVLAVETAAGLPAYLAWVAAQTRPMD